MFDHSARFQTPKNSYANSDSKYPLTFLLDGKTKVAPSESTKWRNGANAWYEFSHGISKAKKISQKYQRSILHDSSRESDQNSSTWGASCVFRTENTK